MKTLIPFFLILAGGYGALTTLVYLLQERLLFHPTRNLVASPADVGLAFEDVQFTSTDGESLHGWWVPHDNPFATILFLHGNAGNISGRVDIIEKLHGMGVNVFIFDYRGYGQSTGAPSEDGLYKDTEAAFQYLIKERSIPASDIVVHGRSLGGGPATWLCERVRTAALILESTFTSVPDAGVHHYPYLPVRMLSTIDFDNLGRVGQCRCPVLIIHSPEDDVIPFAQAERLFAAARDPKIFLEISGAHNEGHAVSGHRFVAGVNAFLADHVRHRR